MYWPDRGSGVGAEPARKPVISAVRQYFTEGGVGQPPTVPGGDWFNQITNELLNVLADAEISPSKNDDTQLLQAIKKISDENLSQLGDFQSRCTTAELPLKQFPVGRRILVSDRDDAAFDVVAGGIFNGFDILDAGGGNTAALVLNRPTPIHFGAKGNKIDDDSDALEHWLNCPYGALYGLGKGYKVTRTLDATQSTFKRLVGDGMTFWSEFGVLSAETVILDIKERPVGQPYIEKVYFDCLDPDSPQSETLNTGETFNWIAKSWLCSLYASEGVTIESSRFFRHKLPYRINGLPGDTFKKGSKTRIFDCWHIECRASGGITGSGVVTLCDAVEVQNNFYWLGGEATFPSNRRLSISDNIAFIPGTPAIDVGGSLGALTDTVKITDNISFGRDPIVCELGTKVTLISGNICVVSSTSPNGVGIGVTSDFAGGQTIDTLKVEGNQISHYNDLGTTAQYSHGIKVNANANSISRVDVTDNTAYGPRICVQVDSNATDCDVSNNNGYQCYRGAVLNCSGTANRNKFTSLGGVPQTGGYGIGVFGGGVMKLKDNDTARFEKDYRLEGALDRYKLLSPIHDHVDMADVIHLANQTGFLYFEGVRAGGVDTFLSNYKRGSTKLNPAPSAGGYIGFVAVGDGGPMKGYGAIQA
ncbi:hypothetical protein [Aeromonas enterica]